MSRPIAPVVKREKKTRGRPWCQVFLEQGLDVEVISRLAGWTGGAAVCACSRGRLWPRRCMHASLPQMHLMGLASHPGGRGGEGRGEHPWSLKALARVAKRANKQGLGNPIAVGQNAGDDPGRRHGWSRAGSLDSTSVSSQPCGYELRLLVLVQRTATTAC